MKGQYLKPFQLTRLWTSGGQTVLEGQIKVLGRSIGPEQLVKTQKVTVRRMLPTAHLLNGMTVLCPDSYTTNYLHIFYVV